MGVTGAGHRGLTGLHGLFTAADPLFTGSFTAEAWSADRPTAEHGATPRLPGRVCDPANP
jgi:hypothetical protein